MNGAQALLKLKEMLGNMKLINGGHHIVVSAFALLVLVITHHGKNNFKQQLLY